MRNFLHQIYPSIVMFNGLDLHSSKNVLSGSAPCCYSPLSKMAALSLKTSILVPARPGLNLCIVCFAPAITQKWFGRNSKMAAARQSAWHFSHLPPHARVSKQRRFLRQFSFCGSLAALKIASAMSFVVEMRTREREWVWKDESRRSPMEPFCRSMACSMIDLLVHRYTLGSAVVLWCEPVNMFAETRKDEHVPV